MKKRRKLDPRTKILWMVLVSFLAIRSKSAARLGIIIVLQIPAWVIAGKLCHVLIDVTRGLIQFFIFLGASQVVYHWITLGYLNQKTLELVLIQIMRVYLMITSSVILFQTTGFEEIATAIRAFKVGERPHGWNQFVEGLAFTIGLAFQFVPLLQRKLGEMVEVRRARGIDLNEGNVLTKAKNYLGLSIPLMIQTLKIIKNTFLALVNYAYTPTKERIHYREIHFRGIDGLAIGIMAIATTAILTLF